MQKIKIASIDNGVDKVALGNEISGKVYVNELVIECVKANAQVVFDEPEEEGYLVRLAREEPADYVSYALKLDGLQGYVDAMNVFN